jgi:hypothetical protein
MVERRAHLAAVHGQDQQAALSSNTGERVEGLVGAMHQLNVGNSSSSAATGSSPPHGLPSPPLQRSYSSQSNFPSFADGDNRLFGDQGGDRDCVVCLAAERTVRGGDYSSLRAGAVIVCIGDLFLFDLRCSFV